MLSAGPRAVNVPSRAACYAERQYTDEVGPWRQYLRIVRDVPE